MLCTYGCNYDETTPGSSDCYPECNPALPCADTDTACCYDNGYLCSHFCNGECYSWYNEPGAWEDGAVPDEPASGVGVTWEDRIKIKVPSEEVDVSLQNFRLFVRASVLTPFFRYELTKTSGIDIRVTEEDGVTLLPFEVVLPESGVAEAGIYVRTNWISSSQDNIFYIYFNNSDAEDAGTTTTIPSGPEWSVWDFTEYDTESNAGNYSGVWHMDMDATVDVSQDPDIVAAKGENGVSAYVETVSDGAGGNALAFQNAQASVYVSPVSEELDLVGNFTVSAWIYPTDSTVNTIFSRGDESVINGFSLKIDEDNSLVLTNSGVQLVVSKTSIALNAWTLVALSQQRNANDSKWDISLWINGVESGTTENDTKLNINAGAPLYIGANSSTGAFDVSADGEPVFDVNENFDGFIDEVRVFKGLARDAHWLATVYKNYMSPNFVVVVPELCSVTSASDTDTSYATCIDADGDGFGAGCANGEDCDDNPLTGPYCYQEADCANLCRDADGDKRASCSAHQIVACRAFPGAYVEVDTDYVEDCNDKDRDHWSWDTDSAGCDGDCVDHDFDGYGANCDRCETIDLSECECDDSNPAAHYGVVWYEDQDNDGYGGTTSVDCGPPASATSHYVLIDGDCDDNPTTGATQYPGNVESCDHLDNNCNGEIDEGGMALYVDDDHDGYPDLSYAPVFGCDDTDLSSHHLISNPLSGNDCNDSDFDCNVDCISDADLDGTIDCKDDCIDYDSDGYGEKCANGTREYDCDDNDPRCPGVGNDNPCIAYFYDEDGDGYGNSSRGFSRCEGILANIVIPDDLSVPNGYVIANDLTSTNYTTLRGDCNDSDPGVWLSSDTDTACANECIDEDGDGLGEGCDGGTDCNDSDVRCGQDTECVRLYRDIDGDGFGVRYDSDVKRYDDTDTYNDEKWLTYMCRAAYDEKGAPAGYVTHGDTEADCLEAHPDVRTERRYDTDYISVLVHPEYHWHDCGDACNGAIDPTCSQCKDYDYDGYGPGCDLGSMDCDQDLLTGPYCTGGNGRNCTLYYYDADSDGHGFAYEPNADSDTDTPDQSPVYRCVAPMDRHWVELGDDCNDNSAIHISDCCIDEDSDAICDNDACVDSDSDGYGENCDPGPDCNDNNDKPSSLAQARDCHSGCVYYYHDGDMDGHGSAAEMTAFCPDADADEAPPPDYYAISDDCAPDDPTRWDIDNGCREMDCEDGDQDGYGVNCSKGTDCDDTDPDWPRMTYPDEDHDGFGREYDTDETPQIICEGEAPLSGFSDNGLVDCNDSDEQHWTHGDTTCDDDCVDLDSDGYGKNCDMGEDCDDNPNGVYSSHCPDTRDRVTFYAVVDRAPRDFPWLNEPEGGIVTGWRS